MMIQTKDFVMGYRNEDTGRFVKIDEYTDGVHILNGSFKRHRGGLVSVRICFPITLMQNKSEGVCVDG